MASNSIPADGYSTPRDAVARQAQGLPAWRIVSQILAPLASLKLTVALLSMAIFLVFVGTLAQDEEEMWEVVRNYFRSFLTWVEFEVFFPKAWFPHLQGQIPPPLEPPLGEYFQFPKSFPFPGGLTVGAFMAMNLVAAHAIRFKVQARGGQLIAGLFVILIGVLVAFMVVISGHNSGGLQDVPAIGWSGVWYTLKGSLVLIWLGSLAGAAVLFMQQGANRPAFWFAAALAAIMTALQGWLLYQGESARLSDPSLRILWQLAQGWLAALIMLAGCALAFRQRAGIVLLHAGVALIMFNELFVGLYTVEERMHIEEGQIINFARDIRSVELAVVDSSRAETDNVVAVPKSRLQKGESLRDERLPFDIELVEFYKNADLRNLKPDEKAKATAGEGTKMAVEEVRASSGADTDSAVDMAAAFVRISDKNGGGELGTYLLSQLMSEQEHAEKVKVGDKTYDLYLRFKRNYKPYSVRLLDVSKRDYVGTATPKDYSSTVHLVDRSQGRDFDRDDIRIWMNNPLRYAGETFYQSGYNSRNGVESTDLQVVTNTGWMIPYLGCMVVVTGLLAQFSLTLVRFIVKLLTPVAVRFQPTGARVPGHKPPRGAATQLPSLVPSPQDNRLMHGLSIGLTLFVVIVCGLYLASKTRPPRMPDDGYDIHAFGQLPLVYQGRVKPFDTLARNSLRIISDREDFLDEDGQRQPAIRLLLDLISEVLTTQKDPKTGEIVKDPQTGEPREIPVAFTYKIFRIENDQVLDFLGLPMRPGSYRYSASEMLPKMEAFEEKVDKAKRLKAEELSLFQKKALELDRKLKTFTMLSAAFRTLTFPAMPTDEELKRDPDGGEARALRVREELFQRAAQIPRIERMLNETQVPLAVPVPAKFRQKEGPGMTFGGPEKWLPYATAWHRAFINGKLLGRESNPAADMMHTMLEAYAVRNSGAFNREVQKYQKWLEKELPADRQNVADDKTDKMLAASNVSPRDDDPAYLNFAKVRRETFFNNFAPFYYSCVLYLAAFLLALIGILMLPLGWSLPFRRASFWLIVMTLAIHSYAIWERIQISGRPPVTNLYSSAVFIGWCGVIFGLLMEVLTRVGILNMVGSIAGFLTLIIAHILAGDGDTLIVLQAVLDTQFWLATHVTCVTLGYAATFVAGFIGLAYVFLGLATPILGMRMEQIAGSSVASLSSRNETVGRVLGWMIYGTLCFALLFSFWGTVLGGLWADDSWGRFWGWDPKENGALIIVLWNAVILHARWGGLVKDRGMAVLALVGNIVTSWSWFGVNELGIGLHSYGFTEGVLRNLGLFVLLNLALIAVGMIPKRLWWSFSTPENVEVILVKEAPLAAEVLS